MFNAYLENTLVYTPELCNGCGMCVEVCPHTAFEMDG
jgi:Pyruvate/2-oxoacid:ferredoxin oxidoreductase delta subunit